MKIIDLKVGTQLKIGMGIILFLVLIIGSIAYYQTSVMHNQTETLYNHPFQTRKAISALKLDIVSMNRLAKDFLITENDEEIAQAIFNINLLKEDAFEEINILYDTYLGPKTDLDIVKEEIIILNAMRDENIRLLHAGKKDEVLKRMRINGITNLQVEKILSKIEIISRFAEKKATELYKNSNDTNILLNVELIILILLILVISFFIILFLIRSINKPLYELQYATQQFKNGNYSVRSNYTSQNEFGTLSESYNNLAETIENDIIVNDKVSKITSHILKGDEAHQFSRLLLSQLMEHTQSQIGAVYLLNNDKSHFEHFESIGLEINTINSFSATLSEGEFGKSLISKKIEHIKNLSENSSFNFLSVSGHIKPSEIITIPIISEDEVVAMISLANLNAYNTLAIRVLDEMHAIFNARIIGVLAMKTIMEFSEKLEKQNSELESQKSELSSQSSELSEQNAELEMQKKQLDEANKLKSNFLSNMSHELRTPLNSVIALSGVLNRRLKNQINEEEYSYLDVIERNGKHLLTLINDILDLSRIEAGKEELEINNFNIKELLDDLVLLIKPQADQKNIKLELIQSDNFPTIKSDYSKCRHILQNLIGNAVKFTEKGSVSISVIHNINSIDIKVSDTGIGISVQEMRHIFDEFRQADGSTSRKYGGTGLGLAIARKYANLLNGEIHVNSKIGLGSDFILVLPLKLVNENFENYIDNQSLKSLTVNEKIEKIKNPDEKTILLVEDSEPAIIQLKEILIEEGYKVKIARNGQEAINLISDKIPDAMILDLMMPEVDGFEVIKFTRDNQKTAQIPVIILTAKHISKDDYAFFKTNNIIQLIQKGDINKTELLNAVIKMLTPKKEIIEITKTNRSEIHGKPKILVVEDNLDNMITTKALLNDDYIIFEALDGFKGVELAIECQPHLILMDIALPEMNGIEAFKKIRENELTRHIPVVVLTASAMKGEKEKIMSYGFDAYITKPIDNIIFFKTINSVLYGK